MKLAQNTPAGVRRALGEQELDEEPALTHNLFSRRLLVVLVELVERQMHTMPELVVFRGLGFTV